MSHIDPAPEGAQPPAAPYGAPTAPELPTQSESAPKKKSILARWWFWVIVVVALFVVIGAINGAGGSGEPAGGGAPQQDASQEPAEEDATEEEAEESLPGVGDTVVVDGFEITVTSVEGGVASVGNEYLSEDAQGEFTLVSVEVTNTGNSAETVLSSSFTVLDADAREFDASSTASIYLGDEGFAFEQINPGNTASGILAFDLPAGTDAQTLEFAPGFFGTNAVTIALN